MDSSGTGFSDRTPFTELTVREICPLDGQVSELFIFSAPVETRGSIPAKCFQTVKQVHHRAHEKRSEAQPKHRAEDSLERVLHRKGLQPQGSVRGQQLV